MKKSPHYLKSSPLLALGAGAAVCFSGGGPAHAVTGLVADSNGRTVFGYGGTCGCANDYMLAFEGRVFWNLYVDTIGTYPMVMAQYAPAGTGFNRTSPPYMAMHSSGVTVNGTMPGGFFYYAYVPPAETDKYVAVRFIEGMLHYGWLHVVSTAGDRQSIAIDRWGYNTGTGPIKTLASTIEARQVALASREVRLQWTNRHEAGISSYLVQRRQENQEWNTVATESPGAGRYAVTLPSADYRVLVEKVDGSTETVIPSD